MSSTDTSTLVEIEAEIYALTAVMADTESRLLHLVGEFDASNGWRPVGNPSCAHWLATVMDIELSTAREKVRVARALRSLPGIRLRFDEGTLSYAKVRQITRVATPDNESEVLSVADQHPASRVAWALADWQQRHEPQAAAARQHEQRSVSFRDEPTGNRVVVAQLPTSVAATLEALVDVEVKHAPADASEPHASLRQQRADALARLVDRLASGVACEGAARTRMRPELVLHRRVGETQLSDGTLLPEPVARHFTCDADVRVMTHYPDGSPADVGRRHRIVTPRLRRLVLERDDYGCQFSGCGSRHFLQVHHIVHWEDGGPTDLNNLVTYCGFHHRFVHHRGAPMGSGTG
jgi:hypothetical protein